METTTCCEGYNLNYNELLETVKNELYRISYSKGAKYIITFHYRKMSEFVAKHNNKEKITGDKPKNEDCTIA